MFQFDCYVTVSTQCKASTTKKQANGRRSCAVALTFMQKVILVYSEKTVFCSHGIFLIGNISTNSTENQQSFVLFLFLHFNNMISWLRFSCEMQLFWFYSFICISTWMNWIGFHVNRCKWSEILPGFFFIFTVFLFAWKGQQCRMSCMDIYLLLLFSAPALHDLLGREKNWSHLNWLNYSWQLNSLLFDELFFFRKIKNVFKIKSTVFSFWMEQKHAKNMLNLTAPVCDFFSLLFSVVSGAKIEWKSERKTVPKKEWAQEVIILYCYSIWSIDYIIRNTIFYRRRTHLMHQTTTTNKRIKYHSTNQ